MGHKKYYKVVYHAESRIMSEDKYLWLLAIKKARRKRKIATPNKRGPKAKYIGSTGKIETGGKGTIVDPRPSGPSKPRPPNGRKRTDEST